MNSSIKEWGDFYILGNLKVLNENIKENFRDDLKFSRIEISAYNDIYSYIISSITKRTLEKNEFTSIDEIVISVVLVEKENKIKLTADVSLGNGEILFEIKPAIISSEEITLRLLPKPCEEALNIFFSLSYEYFAEGIKLIRQNDI